MRLPSQKLPKKVQKHTQTAKHKKSKTKQQRVQEKLAKLADKEAVTMTTEDDGNMDTKETEGKTDEEKYEEKMIRKKANIPQNSYKRGLIKTKYIR